MTTLALQIRDAIYDRIVAQYPDPAFKSKRKIPLTPVQPDQIPALAVYMVNEDYVAVGDENVGPPEYTIDSQITIAVVETAAKEDVLEGLLDKVAATILDLVLCDGTFLGLLDSATNKPIIDSVPRIRRAYKVHKDGEAYYLELQIAMTIRYRAYFEVVAPNELRTIAVSTPALTPIKGEVAEISKIDVPGS